MKTNKIALAAAASLLALGSATWAHGSWSNSGQAASGSAYATPGTTAFLGNTVTPIHDQGLMNSEANGAMPVVAYPATSSADTSSSSGTMSSNSAPAVDMANAHIVGYALPDQTVNRSTVHDDAAAFARVRANASGESPDYPDRVQRFLGTAPGSHDALNTSTTSTSGTGSSQ